MNLTTRQYISFSFIGAFALVCVIIKIYYWYTLRSKEQYFKKNEKGLYYKNISILCSAVVVSTLALYPWYMCETIKMLLDNPKWSAAYIQAIVMIVFGQTGLIINFAMLVKFVFLKRYAKIDMYEIYKEDEAADRDYKNQMNSNRKNKKF